MTCMKSLDAKTWGVKIHFTLLIMNNSKSLILTLFIFAVKIAEQCAIFVGWGFDEKPVVAVSYQTIVDEFKPWKPQIEHVKSKILRNFYVLRRTISFIDRNTAVLLYNTMIQSYFDYCNVIWSNHCFENNFPSLVKFWSYVQISQVYTVQSLGIRQ